MLIGLTGQIGSGKSTVAAILKDAGATVIDADLIGRQVVEDSSELQIELVEAFGSQILDDQGNLDRVQLALAAFSSYESKNRLDELVHPHLLKELYRQLAESHAKGRHLVIDAALLLDWGFDSKVDEVWVIEADEECRLARLAGRGLSYEDARARQEAQLTLEQFRAKASRVIQNNGSSDDLKKQILDILSKISG